MVIRVTIKDAKQISDQNRKRESSTTEASNTGTKIRKLEDQYMKGQLEKLKTMTREEKKKETCGKCGLYFHKKEVCKNPGRVCYLCWNFGYEKSVYVNTRKVSQIPY